MRPLNPLHDQKREEIQAQMAEFKKRGGKIKPCTSEDNANYYGLPVTPSMSQRNRSSGGKPMHINPGSKYPWHSIEVGESFFVEGRSAAFMLPQKLQIHRRHEMKFDLADEDGGCRVTRIK